MCLYTAILHERATLSPLQHPPTFLFQPSADVVQPLCIHAQIRHAEPTSRSNIKQFLLWVVPHLKVVSVALKLNIDIFLFLIIINNLVATTINTVLAHFVGINYLLHICN